MTYKNGVKWFANESYNSQIYFIEESFLCFIKYETFNSRTFKKKPTTVWLFHKHLVLNLWAIFKILSLNDVTHKRP